MSKLSILKNMRYKDFEDYLQEIYIKEENPLDDEIAEGFEEWLQDQDSSDFLGWGQAYADLIYKKK